MTRQVRYTIDVLGRTAGPSGEKDIALRRLPLTIRAASNDNFRCTEQQAFERAVARELSGDVDF